MPHQYTLPKERKRHGLKNDEKVYVKTGNWGTKETTLLSIEGRQEKDNIYI